MKTPNYTNPLTIDIARQLEGKKVRIMAAGYRGQDTDTVITMPKVMTRIEYYRTLQEPCFAPGGELSQYHDRVDMWRQEMPKEKFEAVYKEESETYVIAAGGLWAYCHKGEDVFTIGDADRWAYYELAE